MNLGKEKDRESVPLPVLALLFVLEHGEIAGIAALGDAVLFHRWENGTTGLSRVGAVGKAAILPNAENLAEIVGNLRALHVEGAKALDARRVDDGSPEGKVEHLGEGGGVHSLVVRLAQVSRSGARFGNKPVQQGALPHSAVSAQQRDLPLQGLTDGFHAHVLLRAAGEALIVEPLIEGNIGIKEALPFLVEEVYLVEKQQHRHSIRLRRGEEAIDKDSTCLGVDERDDKHSQVDVGGNDVALLGEVAGLADDVVPPVLDGGDESRLAVGAGCYLHHIPHCHGIGAADAPKAEIPLYLTIEKLAIIRADNVPASRISYDRSSHQTVMISFSLAA